MISLASVLGKSSLHAISSVVAHEEALCRWTLPSCDGVSTWIRYEVAEPSAVNEYATSGLPDDSAQLAP